MNQNQNEQDKMQYELEEINIERRNTITFMCNNKSIKPEKILAYLQAQDLIHLVECVQTIYKEEKNYFEITAKTLENKEEIENKIKNKICIENEVITRTENRHLKDIIKKPVISVVIYEAPCELEDTHIYNKLKQYGEIKGEVQKHRFRGTNILNGNRSVNFTKINLNIPTTLYVKGNRIKIKYEGQDRTPICSYCKEKGHYKLVCPKFIKQQEEYENRVEYIEPTTDMNVEETKNETEDEIRSIQASVSWASVVEKNHKKHTISQPNKTVKQDNLTQRLNEIEQMTNTQIKYKSSKELTEEEMAEKKKRRKLKKKENKEKRKKEINSIRESTDSGDSETDNLWMNVNNDQW